MEGYFISDADAAALRHDGAPDIAAYKRILQRLDDGKALRVAIGGRDPAAVERAGFTRAAQELGVQVAFSELAEDDNVPYLLVTRLPSA